MAYINGNEILFSSNITGGNTAHLEAEIEEHEKRISNLEHQLAPEYVTTDESTAYEKTVPYNACPYAQIDRLGTVGVTENLITADMITVEGTEDAPSFTYENGVLAIEGELTTEHYINIGGSFPSLPMGTVVVMAVPEGFTAYLEGDYFIADDETSNNRIDFENGMATLIGDGDEQEGSDFHINYIEITPTEAMTNPSFSLDCRVKPEKVTALELEGANILVPFDKTGGTNKGITATANADGTITAQGVATETGNFVYYLYSVNTPFVLPAGTYSLFDNNSSAASSIRYYLTLADGTKKDLADYVNKTFTLTQECAYINAAIIHAITEGEYVDKIFYPMLCEGSGAYPYGKYVNGTHTLWEVPAEIQALEDYGKENAYIDLERKVLVGETETDISAYLPDDNLFEIEGAKSIIAVNEGDNPVSSSITYMLKEG